MLTIISPAKTLDFKTQVSLKETSMPQFHKEASLLIADLKKLSTGEIANLMKISPKLALLNFERFQLWGTDVSPKRQAILAFKGEVYTGLQVESLKKHDIKQAQKSLRILSGLYGLLRPLDLIEPYRLEMGSRLINQRGKDLYAFWDDTLTKSLNETLETEGHQYLINLTSLEYFKSLNKKSLASDVVTPVFKDSKDGSYKVISFYAKKARGQMARFIIKHKIKKPEDLLAFAEDGYYYNASLSEKNAPVFTRDH